MQNTEYFNIFSFYSHLKNNVIGASLKKEQHRHSENIFLEDGQESSFQIVERDFLANQSITQGRYNNRDGTIGYWEEFRIRFKVPAKFKLKEPIPKGEYRIRVEAEEDKKPVVKTFVRKSIGFCSWWKEKALPSSLPLSKILNRSLDDYVIS